MNNHSERGNTQKTAAVVLGLSICGIVVSLCLSNQEMAQRVPETLVQLGPRPYYLVEQVDAPRLRARLGACKNDVMGKSDFSIGHRGACLHFPEHSRESYLAAIRMGAGMVECDVTFTKDKVLVCRHSQCDLHTTTDILATDLAQKCSRPPKVVDGVLTNGPDIQCCTSDITRSEFQTLHAKMDAADVDATTIEGYMNAGSDAAHVWRGTVMTHAQSIQLFKAHGVKMIPELKTPSVPMPFAGMTQKAYAQKMIDEYKQANVPPRDVYVQSFRYEDLLYWIENEPAFGRQAVYLDSRYEQTHQDGVRYARFDPEDPQTWKSPDMARIKSDGIHFIAPPMWMLVKTDVRGNIVPSLYALRARKAGLAIIAWTLERSGSLHTGGGWYYQSVQEAIRNDGDVYKMLHVLAEDIGVQAVFSDWPATTTYYANCMGIR